MHWDFMSKMSGFTQLLSSGANGLLTLEGQNSTCADVFYVWVCIAYHLEMVLGSTSVGVMHLRNEVIQIYNHRFNQMITKSSYEIFLLAYYLHPSKHYTLKNCIALTFHCKEFYHNGGLQLTMPVIPDGTKLQSSHYPTLFRRLLVSVLNIFRGEQLRLLDGGVEVVEDLVSEFICYAYNEKPFRNHLWTQETKPRQWWESLAKDSNASLLSVRNFTQLVLGQAH